MLKVANSVISASRITGVLPVVNGGTGVTTSTGTGNTVLSASPTLSDNVTLSTGNLVIGTAGKGIDFSATPGTGTSELLDDYEEGTWTATVFGSTGAGTYELSANSSFTYQKVGNNVTVLARILAAAVVTGGGTGDIRISGLPFNMSATVYGSPFTAVSSGVVFTGSYLGAERVTSSSTATLYPYGISALGVQTQIPIGNFVANSIIAFQFQYRV